MPNSMIFALRKCTKKILAWRIILIILIFLNLLVIWNHSAKVSVESDRVSKTIAQDVSQKVVEDYDNLSNLGKEKQINEMNKKIRSLGHFAEYAPLGFLLFLLMVSLFKQNNKGTLPAYFIYFLFALFLSVISALIDETHQLFVKGRTFQLVDIFVDTMGALVGCVVALIPTYFLKRKLQ